MLRIQDPPKESKQEEVGKTLDGLAREGARRMLIMALEEEVSDYVERHVEERDEDGLCGTRDARSCTGRCCLPIGATAGGARRTGPNAGSWRRA